MAPIAAHECPSARATGALGQVRNSEVIEELSREVGTRIGLDVTVPGCHE